MLFAVVVPAVVRDISFTYYLLVRIFSLFILFSFLLTIWRSKLPPLDLLTALVDDHGYILRLRIMTTEVVILSSYDIIKEAYNHPNLQGRPRIVPIEDYIGRRNIGVVYFQTKNKQTNKQKHLQLATLDVLNILYLSNVIDINQ